MATPALRLATPADEAAIGSLMAASISDIFPAYYTPEQVEKSIRYIGIPDRDLIGDGTYFVADVDGAIVAAGGWSKRAKLYAGSAAAPGDDRILDPAFEAAHVRAMFVHPQWTRRGLGRAIIEASELAAKQTGFSMLTLMATLPGVPLYLAYGFKEIAPVDVAFPDGSLIPMIEMEKPVD